MNGGMRKPVILLVEDNRGHQELLKISLKRTEMEYALFVTDNGEKALHYLQQNKNCHHMEKVPWLDLILLDLNLPGISGMEVLRIIKNDNKLKIIPVIILTSSDDSDETIQAYAYGADDYMLKPVTSQKLWGMLCEINLYWQEIVSISN